MFNSVSQTEYSELSQNEKPLFRFKNANWYHIYINSINRIYKWLWYHCWETWIKTQRKIKILKTLFPNRIHVNRLIDYISVCVSYQKRRRGKKSGRMEEVHTGDTLPRAFCFLGSDSRLLQRDSSSTVSTRTGLPQNELKCASTF